MNPEKKATEMTVRELARYIDQSVLKPEFTVEEIKRYTQEGIDFGCKTICINPSSLPIVAPMVKETDTGICIVCDFPFGTALPETKAELTEKYCSEWEIEDLDIVANFGRLRSGDSQYVIDEVGMVVEAAHKHGTLVKVIIETDTLDEALVKEGTRCAIEAGADFIKSSTGFITGFEAKGATTEVARWMMDAAEGKIKVKGSGGIRTREHFLELIDMGIDRMGVGYRSTPDVLNCTPEDARNL